MLFTLACAKRAPETTQQEIVCGPENETINGYRDDDGCPDQLARIRITVYDRDKRPMKGILVRWPGLSAPLTSDMSGSVSLFELIPVPAVSLELEHPETGARQAVKTELLEGANELEVATTWKANPASK